MSLKCPLKLKGHSSGIYFSGVGTTGATGAGVPVKFLLLIIRVCPLQYSLHTPHHGVYGKVQERWCKDGYFWLAN